MEISMTWPDVYKCLVTRHSLPVPMCSCTKCEYHTTLLSMIKTHHKCCHSNLYRLKVKYVFWSLVQSEDSSYWIYKEDTFKYRHFQSNNKIFNILHAASYRLKTDVTFKSSNGRENWEWIFWNGISIFRPKMEPVSMWCITRIWWRESKCSSIPL